MFSREIENVKNIQMKTTTYEVKNSLDGLKNRMKMT